MSGQLAQVSRVGAVCAVTMTVSVSTRRGAVGQLPIEAQVVRQRCKSQLPVPPAGLACGLVSARRVRRAFIRLPAAHFAAAAGSGHLLRCRSTNAWQANTLLQPTGRTLRERPRDATYCGRRLSSKVVSQSHSLPRSMDVLSCSAIVWLLVATALVGCGGSFFSFDSHVESGQPLPAGGAFTVASSVAAATVHETVLATLNAALIRRGLTPAPAGVSGASVTVTVSDTPDPTIGLPEIFGKHEEVSNWLQVKVHTAGGQLVWAAHFCGAKMPAEQWLAHVKQALPDALTQL